MVIKTFKQLQDDALRWFDEVEDADELRANVKQAIAAAHVSRLAERQWPFMQWHEPLRLVTEIGKRTYPLHQEFHTPIYFYNTSTKRWMRQVSPTTLIAHAHEGVNQLYTDTGEDWIDQVGSALKFELGAIQQVMAQPSAASVITVSSSSTSDGASQSVIIRGDTDDGVTEETLTVGTLGAASAGLVSFTRILRVTKLGTWSGTMLLTSDAAAVTILKLFASEVARSYQTIKLLTTPSVAESIEYHFYRQPSPLVYDNDVPDIPAPFQDILVYDALIDLAAYNAVEPNSLDIWASRQTKLERGLMNAHGEPLSLGREIEYSHYVPRD